MKKETYLVISKNLKGIIKRYSSFFLLFTFCSFLFFLNYFKILNIKLNFNFNLVIFFSTSD